jgi:hypothetical protein
LPAPGSTTPVVATPSARLDARDAQGPAYDALGHVHQSGGGQETSGSLETVDSRFLQTFENVIRAFPAWPAGRDGKFVRPRAKGAFLVSAEREAGREVGREVSGIEVVSEKAGTATFDGPWRTGRPTVIDGSTHRPVPLSFGRDADRRGDLLLPDPSRAYLYDPPGVLVPLCAGLSTP